ncbi:hypothetical protein HA402_007860 [Bradysia odoriphaga]|nr:hypothetical protein HA402_007860 [Bradysia odoriphaga]
MTEVNPDTIKKTQTTLGKYVKKPALTEKLLNKPPFRFLHDIITSVIQSSGYLDGLFEPNEMVSANIKDKDAKILFLQKVIDVVKISTKENVNAKPSKIVAGQEPERTNELLQLIGLALSKKISSTEAVKMVRNNEIPKASKNSTTKPSKVSKQSSIDSVKTKSKSSDDTKASMLKDNKINQKVKETKDKNNERQQKERIKDKETKTSRDAKKPTKEVKGSEKIRPEKVRAINGTEVKKSSTKMIKEESKEKVQKETISKVDSVAEITQLDKVDEVVVNSNDADDLQKSFEPEIVSVQMQSGLSKSNNDQDVAQTVINGDIMEKRKSADRSDRKIETIASEEKESHEIHETASNVNGEPDEPSLTSNGDNLVEQNGIAQDADKSENEPKSSRKASSKKDKENVNANDTTRTAQKIIASRTNSTEATETPSLPRPRTSLRPPSVRPASARPGAPRRRDRNVEIVLQPDGNMPKPAVNIKIDPLNVELDDDGENLVIIEDSSNQLNDSKYGADALNENDEEQQGHLVQQILETQKEFLKIDEDSSEKRRSEAEWDLNNSHQRQTSAKQMDSLRDSIQKLTRSINPLGKLMDFLQEDVDSMQMELSMWKNSYESTKLELKREEGLTETAIEPLRLQLAHIESDIKDQIEIMDLVRVDIMENEEKILKLLTEM